MQFFNKKFFLYVTLTLSCWMQSAVANTEEDASITANCPDPYDILEEEDLSKYTISCANMALERLCKADDDADSIIKAVEIVLKVRDLFAEADDVDAQGLDDAEAKFKEARAKAVEKLSQLIRSDKKDCKRALKTLLEISPLKRRILKNREKNEYSSSPCENERGTANNEPCQFRGKGKKCKCESKFAPISCGCNTDKGWCECKDSYVCED
jgi:hypothetical protein